MNPVIKLALIALTLTACSPASTIPAHVQPSSPLSSASSGPDTSLSPISALASVKPVTAADFGPGSKGSRLPVTVPVSEPISTIGFAGVSFSGKVFDEQQQPLESATVVARSRNEDVQYTATTELVNGEYEFNNTPPGIEIEITVLKPGYTPRTQVVTPTDNKENNPENNHFDFGTGPEAVHPAPEAALSDQPEVLAGRLILGENYVWQGLALRFSEPMNPESVAQALRIYHPEAPEGSTEKLGYDSEDFELSWNAEFTELSLHFKLGTASVDPAEIQNFRFAFTGPIRDAGGVSRSQAFFRTEYHLPENEVPLIRFIRGEFPHPAPSPLYGGAPN